MTSAYLLGSGVGVLIAFALTGYSMYLRVRHPERLKGVWRGISSLIRTPQQGIAFALALCLGWISALVIVSRLQIAEMSRDQQISILALMLSAAIPVLAIIAVLSYARNRRP